MTKIKERKLRKFNNRTYELVDSRIFKLNGHRFKDSYWMEVIDAPPGVIRDTLNIVCRIPSGYSDIDIRTLKEDCIIPGYIVNEPTFTSIDLPLDK